MPSAKKKMTVFDTGKIVVTLLDGMEEEFAYEPCLHFGLRLAQSVEAKEKIL